MLTPHARVVRSGEGTALATPDADYTFGKRSAKIVAAAAPQLNGSRSLAEIATEISVPEAVLSATLSVLSDEHLSDVTPILHAKSPDRFLEAYFVLCDRWAVDIFVQPFWESILSGHSSRKQVLGWCVEFYHRTVGADEHNAKSVEYCRDPEIRVWLEEHFLQELGHGRLFLDGLAASGLDPEQVAASPPLPSTRALIEYFNDLATSNTVAYLGCYGVLHSPRRGQTKANLDNQFDLLVRHYEFAAGILNKIREHAQIDLDLEHDQIVLEKLARRERAFPPEVAADILRAARGSVNVFCEYFRGIHEYYGRVDALVPRTRSLSNETVHADS